MIVVKTFVSELSKRIEMLNSQIVIFEEKVSQVKSIEDIIKKATLKEVSAINGDDLALISEENYKRITEIVNFNDNEDNLNKFIMHAVTNKLYAKLLLDGKVDDELEKKSENAKNWLEEQANSIKEFIVEFKLSNENYLKSLKQSDNLYKKYLEYFSNDELVKPIINIEEFNDVLTKCGLIMSEKWQLLKYIAQKNITLSKQGKNKDILDEIKVLLNNEGKLLENITSEQLDFCISLLDMEESKIKSLNLSKDDLIRYQKIPILNDIKVIYEETLDMVKNNGDKKKIDANKKELKSFKDSFDFFKKIN